MNSGTIFDIKKFAIHDGPGLRTTVFLKGCPLGCWLCHNPESQKFEPELMLRESRCDLCGDCIDVCAPIAISKNGTAVRIDRARCDLCGACADVCLSGAIEIVGREVSVEDVLEEIEKDTIYYDESGGGVTFSGGEPLHQPEFLIGLLDGCKARGIRTAVDTSGNIAPNIFRRVAKRVDIFLFDLKVMDDHRHTEFTGQSNRSIHENLRWLAENDGHAIVRFPLHPGINDDAENVSAMGTFLSELPSKYPVDILPYHRIGVEKYGRLDREHKLPALEPPARELIVEVVRQLEVYELDVTVRGERP